MKVKSVRVNDIEMNYDDYGQGQALVFVHGWGTSGRVWDGQLDLLNEGFRIIRVNWRGCGGSEMTPSSGTISQVGSDLNSFAEALDLHDPVLICASMGGNFGIEAAIEEPDRWRALIFLDCAYHVGACVDPQDFIGLADGLAKDWPGSVHKMVTGWYPEGDSKQALTLWALQQVYAAHVWTSEFYVDHVGYDPRDKISKLASRIPLEFLHGTKDGDVPISLAYEAAKAAGKRVVELDGLGHFPHQEDPVQVNSALRSALSRVGV